MPSATGVDALCIDQRPSPKKFQQLQMMDRIYQGACATIIALYGEDSNAGLPGVSRPRRAQAREMVDGHELATVFPAVDVEYNQAKHTTRAWTLQEMVMSRRRILFIGRGESLRGNQIILDCRIEAARTEHVRWHTSGRRSPARVSRR